MTISLPLLMPETSTEGPTVIRAHDEREAEDTVERWLDAHPDDVLEVYIAGKLAYRAKIGPFYEDHTRRRRFE